MNNEHHSASHTEDYRHSSDSHGNSSHSSRKSKEKEKKRKSPSAASSLTEFGIFLATLIFGILFLIASEDSIYISDTFVLNKYAAMAVAFSFSSMGGFLYLLRDRIHSVINHEFLRRFIKGFCQLISFSGILFMICLLAFHGTPTAADNNAALENRLQRLEMEFAQHLENAHDDSLDATLNNDNIPRNIPAFWQEELDNAIQTANSHQNAIGEHLISFVWASDTHIPDNSSSEGSTEYLGELMNAALVDCSIRYATISGDLGTQGASSTEAEHDRQYQKISKHLYPLWGSEHLLAAVGNHDGCWGNDGGYYLNQYSPKKMYDVFFSPQAKDESRVFSDDGLYFFADDDQQKVRYILLNSQFAGEQYLTDENGHAFYDRFNTSCYGQEQLDWLADVALDLPAGYDAIIVTHVPPTKEFAHYTVDQAQLNGILTAFCNKTSFVGRLDTGVDGWTNSSVDVDFTGASGELIAVLSGHVHKDTVDTTALPCPVITISTAGGDLRDDFSRTVKTGTETAFDIVTIDRGTRTIYCTRVGAGDDRVIPY